MVVPFPFPFPFPECPPNTRPPAPQAAGSGSRKQDRRNDSTPARLFIAVFCQPLLFFGYICIFTFSSVTRGFLVRSRNDGGDGGRGWRGRRWKQMAQGST